MARPAKQTKQNQTQAPSLNLGKLSTEYLERAGHLLEASCKILGQPTKTRLDLLNLHSFLKKAAWNAEAALTHVVQPGKVNSE